jgi:hypothetical protein
MEEKKQIGHGSLYIITSAEENQKSQGRMLWLDIKLIGFKIAHLDKNKKIIEDNVVTFDEPSAPAIAEFLAWGLQHLLERSYVGSTQMNGSSVMVVRDNGDVSIKNAVGSVKVAHEDIIELIDQLGYIVAMTHVRSPY